MSCKPAVLILLGAAWIAILSGTAGCASGGRARSIDSLHVFTVPVALDLDGTPGPDAFGLTLYASAASAARGVPVTTGSIEIQMYDGTMAMEGTAGTPPLRVWTFNPADLKKIGVKTSLGTGYRFTLRWNESAPRQGHISVKARYLSSRGTTIQSIPTVIAVPATVGG